MKENLVILSIRKASTIIGLASIAVLVAASTSAPYQEDREWKQWTAQDVHEILYMSPWVSNCCREWDTGPYKHGGLADLGQGASIVSSLHVREALVRRMQLGKHYEKLNAATRKEADQRIAACLNQSFDNYIVLSFSFRFSDRVGAYPISAVPSQIHLLTSDGLEIAGQVVSDSIATKCGGVSKDPISTTDGWPGWTLPLYGPEHELAFPRYVDGKPTIRPNDKEIRIKMDLYTEVVSYRSVGELDFSIDKLIFQGKPDF